MEASTRKALGKGWWAAFAVVFLASRYVTDRWDWPVGALILLAFVYTGVKLRERLKKRRAPQENEEEL